MKLFFILLFSILPLIHVNADTYKVAAYAWEPFVELSHDNGGISIGVLKAALKNQGHNIELVPMTWEESLKALEKNEVDILPAVWYKEERTKTMMYSASYASNRLVFIKRKSNQYEYNGLSSLYDKVVGVVKGYAYDESLMKDKNIEFVEADTLNSNVEKVVNGEVDLTLDDEIAARFSIKPSLLEKIDFTKNALSEIPLFITCSKSNPNCSNIIESFNRGFTAVNAK